MQSGNGNLKETRITGIHIWPAGKNHPVNIYLESKIASTLEKFGFSYGLWIPGGAVHKWVAISLWLGLDTLSWRLRPETRSS